INGGNGRGIAAVKSDTDTWWGINGRNDPYLLYYNEFDPFVPNRWTHWAASVSGSSITWYLNGVKRLTTVPGAYAKNLSAPLYVGALEPGGDLDFFWTGDVDEVTFYNKQLSPEQIQGHYIAARYGTNSRPVIVRQPESRTIIEGGTVTFVGGAEGSLPI